MSADEVKPVEAKPAEKKAAPAPKPENKPLEEVAAKVDAPPPPKKPIDPHITENMQPVWREKGLKICEECGWAMIPTTGLCQHGGSSHKAIKPYTPNGNSRTVTFGHG